jgi:hypothetical protein
MLAMMMPGAYFAFAYIQDGAVEQVEEVLIVTALYPFNLWCLFKVAVEEKPYYAPLSVFVHGLVDSLHHFRLFPSSKHVSHCCPLYPKMCGTFDVCLAIAMLLMIWMFS